MRTTIWALPWIIPTVGCTQYFAPLGPGFDWGQAWDMLPVDGRLYMAGDFAGTADSSVNSRGVLSWDGASFEAVGCGLFSCDLPQTWHMSAPARSLAYWQDELYIAGDFNLSSIPGVAFIARFNGNEWVGVGGGMDGPVRGLKAYPDGLYAAGWFNNAGNTPAEGLARWDGEQWHSVHDLPLLDDYPINMVNDVAIINDRIYIGGNFSGTPQDSIYSIAQWDGTTWNNLDHGFVGGLTQILKLEVHDSLLYIAGAFADTGQYGHPLNPASGIIAWDGEDWVELGSGTDGANIPWVTDMAWHNDTLYVCGDFNRIGGVEAGGLARWDGQQWCALLPSPPGAYGISCLTFFNDTLHLGGGLVYMGSDSVNRVAKWIGGNHVEECEEPVGIPQQVDNEVPGITLYPNPATVELNVLHQGRPLPSGLLRITDTIGRSVAERPLTGSAVPLGPLAEGVYHAQVTTEQGRSLGSVVFVIAY